LEINPTSCITLMGVGDAYLGIKQLLTSRGIPSPLLSSILKTRIKQKADTPLAPKDAKSKISCILSFVSGSLRPVKSDIDPYLSTWYKQNSLIYVSPDHACWSDEDSSRKVKKHRFGRVVCAEIERDGGGGDVGRMLKRYQTESTAFIASKVAEWERERLGDRDPDETEDEVEAEAEVDGERDFVMQGVMQSVRVPVI